MKYLRVLGARSAHRAVPGASQQGIGKCGADVVSGARLAVGSEREEIVPVPALLQVILVDAREHEDARRLVVDVEQPEGNRLADQLLESTVGAWCRLATPLLHPPAGLREPPALPTGLGSSHKQ